MQISNVDVSLSQGRILNKSQLFLIYFSMAVCCCFPLLTIIMLLIQQIEWDFELALLMSSLNILAIAFLAVLIYIKVKDKKLKNKIMIWLEDAVEIKAYSKKVGENRLGLQPKAIKIQVQFSLNGLNYIKESTAKVFGGWDGYVGCFNKYADREVNILYSPKYNEIMIIKN